MIINILLTSIEDKNPNKEKANKIMPKMKPTPVPLPTEAIPTIPTVCLYQCKDNHVFLPVELRLLLLSLF